MNFAAARPRGCRRRDAGDHRAGLVSFFPQLRFGNADAQGMPTPVQQVPPSPEALAQMVKNIPSGPRILPRLQRLLRDGNVGLQEILEPIRVDQGIAARVLQIGNSPAFSKGARCQTIEESINRLGLRRVYEVVSSALCSEALVRPVVSYGLRPEEFWKLSLSAGIAAECLAVRTGEDRNAAYTIGLMHGLGMVVIDSWLQGVDPQARLIYRGFEAEYSFDEAARLKFTQAEAAAAMLEFWGFPGEMTGPLRHQYQRDVPAEHMRMVALLRTAKWLRNLASGVHPPPPETMEPRQLQLLKLHQSELSALLDEVRNRMQESRDLLAGG